MRKNLRAAFVAFLFALPAHGSPRWLLTHAEFVHLTPREQREYLREVRRVIVSLPQNSMTFASSSKLLRGPAQAAGESPEIEDLLSQAEKWRGTPPIVPAYGHLTEEQAADLRTRYKNSMWWLVTAKASINDLPKGDPKRAALEERAGKLENFFLGGQKVFATSIAKNGELDKATAAVRQGYDGKTKSSTPDLIPKNALVSFDSKQVVGSTALTSAPMTSERPFYRCMYAGFVIKQDPCQAPSDLPRDMQLRGVDVSHVSCPGAAILCNPLIFGLNASCYLEKAKDNEKTKCLADAKPICVQRSVNATQKCGEKSKDSSLAAAAALIEANKETWDEYSNSFYELCDDMRLDTNVFAQVKNGQPRRDIDRAKTDIAQTCTNAKKQLARISEKYRSIETARPGAPKAPDKSAPAATKSDGQE